MPVFLTLGQVTFANFEIPSKINIGGRQSVAVHQLVGGQRIVDVMGRIDDDISWSGLFSGSTATFRARFLDSMRVTGAPIPLTFSQFNYLVIIEHFTANFERFYQLPYTITCKVVQDLNQPFPVLLPVAYNDAILNLLTEANDLATVIANPSISSAMAVMSETINNIPSLSDASDAELASALAATTSAESVVSSSISALSAEIF